MKLSFIGLGVIDYAFWAIIQNDFSRALNGLKNQPCFCLCLGFSQITMILPFLLMILHFSHIGFTEGLTFILKYLL